MSSTEIASRLLGKYEVSEMTKSMSSSCFTFIDIPTMVIFSTNHVLLLWMFPWRSLRKVRVVQQLTLHKSDSVIFLMIRRHLIFSICDLLLEFLIPESCDQAFQKSLLQSLSRVSDKDSHHT